jgi:hypothetical protein
VAGKPPVTEGIIGTLLKNLQRSPLAVDKPVDKQLDALRRGSPETT